MTHDWREWHEAYDHPGSPLSRRLATVQQCIAATLDAAPAGPIRIVSMCAGEGRDLLGVLEDHPRRTDACGRLVELDPELAATARSGAPAGLEVRCADAGTTSAYAGAVPADLALVCGVFGNITDADMMRTIDLLPTLCAPQATVIWTRHRRPPDATPSVRRRFADNGFDEVAFLAPEGTMFGIGVHRLVSPPQPFRGDVRIFDFVGFRNLDDVCSQCGFSYSIGRAEITPWLRSDAHAFVEKLGRYDDASVRVRPAPDVWSPLEYACHVRDVLRVQTERALLAQREIDPVFVPMGRDERVIEDRYNEQDPDRVTEELLSSAETFASLLDGLDAAGWERTGMYNYPEPALRTVEWIGIHTTHELLHHRGDLG
jgi:DinB family protein